MLASIVYKLTALNSTSIAPFHGRKLHAMLFSIFARQSEELAAVIHGIDGFKPFTISQLQPVKGLASSKNRDGIRIIKNRNREFWDVKAGDEFYWRVNLLTEELIPAVMEVPIRKEFLLDRLSLCLDEIICDGSLHTGVLEPNDLVAAALSMEHVKKVQFEFTSPVTFRNFDDDYAFPLPDMIFSSLANKWNSAHMSIVFDMDSIRSVAAMLLPQEWNGKSERVYFASDRGALGFKGKISFSLKRLTAEEREAIVILTSFAPFAGVGRLTGQGFGQTIIKLL